jgi:hypothetical protein
MRNKIDVKFGLLFPWQFLFLAGLVLIISISLLADRTIPAIGLIAVCVLVLSAYSGTEINNAEKVYREYNAFFFIKKGKHIKYDSIERIFINRGTSSQRVHTAHTNHSSQFKNEEFNAFIKFEDGTKIHLLTKRNKQKLLLALEKISATLQVPVVDTTER